MKARTVESHVFPYQYRAQREALRRLVFDHNIADFQKWFYAIFSKTPERIFEILMERDRGGKALSLSYSIFNVRPVIYSYAEYRLAKMSSDGGRVARRGAAAAKPTNLTDSSEIWNIVRNSRVMCKSEILDQSVENESFYRLGNIAFSCFDNHF